MRRAIGCGALVLLACAGDAAAQVAPVPGAHRVAVSGGLAWSGSYAIGSADARLRTNPTGAPFVLFSTSSRVERAAGVGGRVEVAVTRTLGVELGVAYSRPRVSVAISGDPEAPAQVLPGEQLQQYEVGAGAVWQLPVGGSGRLRPFVSGGAGYLRQLHEERTLAETGGTVYAGAGLRYWLRGGSGAVRAVGLRADARAVWRVQGFDLEGRTRLHPSVAVGLFVGF